MTLAGGSVVSTADITGWRDELEDGFGGERCPPSPCSSAGRLVASGSVQTAAILDHASAAARPGRELSRSRGAAMESARWKRIQELFHAAADLPVQDQRPVIQSACGGDEGLLADVLALLDEDARASSPLDCGVARVASE